MDAWKGAAMTTSHAVPVRIHVHGNVPDYAGDLATTKVSSVLARHVAVPVISARVVLTMAPDPAVTRPAIAEATVGISGRMVRAQAAGQTMRAAIGLMADRLRIRLDRTARF
jgi:ribosome-associated translation inhibitor RaiA